MKTAADPPPWQTAIRQRLLDLGAARDWSDLWPQVVSIRLELLAALAPISEVQAAWQPSVDSWSIEETVQHLLPSSEGVVAIVRALAAGDDPLAGTPYHGPGDLTAHEFAPTFEGSFTSLLAALRGQSIEFGALPRRWPAAPDLERTFEHQYFGPLPAPAWFAFQRVHDRAHLNQIEEIVAADGFPR